MKTRTGLPFADFIKALTDAVLSNKTISAEDARRILAVEHTSDLFMLLAHANVVRDYFHGPRVQLCAIVNARSGRCPEDCAFCAQSARHAARITVYPLLSKKKMTSAALRAKRMGAERFSIVTSGRGAGARKSFATICEAVRNISHIDGMRPCASLGMLARSQFRDLQASGLRRYHHNLEAGETFFGSICTTHRFADRIQTVRMAREAGLEVCVGGIIGLGESLQQRVELAAMLRELDVDSIPLNFLNPIPGTPLGTRPLLRPTEVLATIAMFRFVLPAKEIRICGGREINLKTLQPLMYMAGANGTMIGNYLTTSGRNRTIDIQEIADLGLTCGMLTGHPGDAVLLMDTDRGAEA